MNNKYQQAAAQIMAGRGLAAGANVRLRVTSGSMRPRLQIGDIIQVQSVAQEQIKPGEILVIRRPADLVTHRLIRVSTAGMVVKGDRLAQSDPPVAPEEVLGRVTAVERKGRVYPLEKPWRQMAGSVIARIGSLEAGLFSSGLGLRLNELIWAQRVVRAPFVMIYWVLNF